MAIIKYFFYSAEQLRMRKEVELRLGKKFKVGHVIKDGVRKPFTEMTSSPKSRYADAKLVTSGDPSIMIYTEPKGE